MAFDLQILHTSDLEAGIPALTDAVNFSTVINALKDDYANTLILSSGDNYIPGAFLSAGSDPSLASVIGAAGVGRPDIALLNNIGFQASAFGNHEFDLGTSTIQSLIVPSGSYEGARFPYLSANLDFSNDANLSSRVVAPGQDFTNQTPANAGRISKSAVLTVGGDRIGIVGATTPTLPFISSPGAGVVVTPSPFAAAPIAAQLDALATIIQPEVDALTATGINKIVLLAHMQQLEIERELAKRLTDVDVIIAGGSHTVLPDSTDRLRPGDTAPAGIAYPITETNPTTGEQVLVVNTGANYSYVGRLVAQFDDSGRIIPSSLDPAINGAYATDAASVAALTAANLAAGGEVATPNPKVVEITNALRQVIVTKDSNIFGSSQVFLNGTRESVRAQETNLGNITADANLFVAKQADPTVVISLKNGGGIRDNIGAVSQSPGATDPNAVVKLPTTANPLANKQEGQISQLDIENSLRFNNGLSLVTVTAAQLKELIESGVSGVRPGATPGNFPQIGGFAFSYDSSRAARTATTPGDRVRSLAINNADGTIADVVVKDGQVVGDPNRTFRMVTLDFLASGGDGYPFPQFGTTLNRVDLTAATVPRSGTATFAANASEQDAFAEYLASVGSFTQADTDAIQDARIQNLAVRDDSVLAGATSDRVLTKIGAYTGEGSEIGAYDPISQRLFVVATGPTIEILELSNPSNPNLVTSLDFSTYGDVSSVAVSNGLVAISVISNVRTDPGKVLFLDSDGTVLKEVTVGSEPDMLTFTPDGKKVLVAVEGEPSSYNQPDSIDPVGAVSIVDLANGVSNATVLTAGFESFNDRKAELQAKGVRITGPNASVAQDFEPEYLTVSADSKTAWVTLQENNAIAIVDIPTATVTDIVPLGFKDHSLPGNGLDASDRDGKINIQNYPVFGLYQPDGVAQFTAANGRTYLVTGNEGDTRDYTGFTDEIRVGNSQYNLDPTIFPNAAELKANTAIGRLTVSSASGDLDGDGDFDRIEVLGGRSFSIWDAGVKQVFDSGDQFEQITAKALPTYFNSDRENNTFDTRSDNKGPEPEGITVGRVDGRVYAFIGLERVGGVMTYDVTNPNKPTFVEYTNTRNFTAQTPTDSSPEGLAFISANRSPNGKPLLVVTQEGDSSTAIYQFTPPASTGENGQNGFVVQQGEGTATISSFGGVGVGVNPSAVTIAEVDTLKFTGADLTARNLLLNQNGSNLEITFEGVAETKVVLNDFALENLENLRQNAGSSVELGNFLFDGQTTIQDSFDVFNRDDNSDRIFNRNSVTFLNDLDNDIRGFNVSNDVINGQDGDDRIDGLSGNDLLRGGLGNDSLNGGQGEDILVGGEDNDWLIGGKGNDRLVGGSGRDIFGLAKGDGTDTIADFEVGNDLLALPAGLSFNRLSIFQGVGNQFNDTLIGLAGGQQALAVLTGVNANTITNSSFILT